MKNKNLIIIIVSIVVVALAVAFVFIARGCTNEKPTTSKTNDSSKTTKTPTDSKDVTTKDDDTNAAYERDFAISEEYDRCYDQFIIVRDFLKDNKIAESGVSLTVVKATDSDFEYYDKPSFVYLEKNGQKIEFSDNKVLTALQLIYFKAYANKNTHLGLISFSGENGDIMTFLAADESCAYIYSKNSAPSIWPNVTDDGNGWYTVSK